MKFGEYDITSTKISGGILKFLRIVCTIIFKTYVLDSQKSKMIISATYIMVLVTNNIVNFDRFQYLDATLCRFVTLFCRKMNYLFSKVGRIYQKQPGIHQNRVLWMYFYLLFTQIPTRIEKPCDSTVVCFEIDQMFCQCLDSVFYSLKQLMMHYG